jgi:hypothetical protein
MGRLACLTLLLAGAQLSFGAGAARAQGAFSEDHVDFGLVVGAGNLGGADVSLGLRYDRGLLALPELGNGVISIQGGLNVYRYRGPNFDIVYLPIATTANYHFAVDNERLDPFVGVGFGYLVAMTSYLGAFRSGLYLVGRAGVRYAVTSRIALYADVGAGSAAVNAGLMWKRSVGN